MSLSLKSGGRFLPPFPVLCMLYHVICFFLFAGALPGFSTPDTPKGVFKESLFSFGSAKQGTVIAHEFVLRNEGTAALRILGVRTTTPLLLDRTPAQLLPGAEMHLWAKLDTGKLSGPFKGVISISLNDPELPEATLVVEGRVIPPIELSPRPVFFVAGQRGEKREAAIDIINHEPDPLRIESVEHPRERFTTKLETLEEGQRYRLSLILNPDGPGGKKTETITIRTSNPERPVLKIDANTYLRERVYAFPDEVDLGTLPMAVIKANPELLKRVAQTLMVYQVGGSDFHVKVGTDLPMLDLKSERGPNGDRYQNTITIIAQKLQTGPIKGSIVIETNDPEFPNLTIPVRGNIR